MGDELTAVGLRSGDGNQHQRRVDERPERDLGASVALKLRSIRGPNWVEASVSVTIMIEKTTPTTVITAAASAVGIWRAASAVPEMTHDGR